MNYTVLYRHLTIQTYGVENFDMDCNSFKTHCKELVRRKFIESWKCELNDLDKNSRLRMYKLIKTNFSMEPYINLIKEAKYRRSLTKLGLSSHNLEIERGRHTKPVTPVIERLCIVCGVVDDELHFVTSCKKHTTERERLYSYVDSHVPNFCNLNNAKRFIYLPTNENPSILLHITLVEVCPPMFLKPLSHAPLGCMCIAIMLEFIS